MARVTLKFGGKTVTLDSDKMMANMKNTPKGYVVPNKFLNGYQMTKRAIKKRK